MIRISSMLAEQIIKDKDRVGLIGYPAAGKTTLALKHANKKVFHTDDYLKHDHEARPEMLLSDLRKYPMFIVEGNEVTRLINRGLVLDALILVEGSERNDKATNGLRGRVDKFVREYGGLIYVVNPRIH